MVVKPLYSSPVCGSSLDVVVCCKGTTWFGVYDLAVTEGGLTCFVTIFVGSVGLGLLESTGSAGLGAGWTSTGFLV